MSPTGRSYQPYAPVGAGSLSAHIVPGQQQFQKSRQSVSEALVDPRGCESW